METHRKINTMYPRIYYKNINPIIFKDQNVNLYKFKIHLRTCNCFIIYRKIHIKIVYKY